MGREAPRSPFVGQLPAIVLHVEVENSQFFNRQEYA